MALPSKKFPTLKHKLEKKTQLEKELKKTEDEIDEITGENKAKINHNK